VLEVHLVVLQALVQVLNLSQVIVIQANLKAIQMAGNFPVGDEVHKLMVACDGLKHVSLFEEIPEVGEGHLADSVLLQNGLYHCSLFVLRLLGRC